MRSLLCLLVLCLLGAAGCAGRKPAASGAAPAGNDPAKAPPSTANKAVIVTPATAPVGKVILFNATARHVVLNFPLGKMPPPDQRLSLYRRGLKVGEVKTTTWQRENNIIADMVAGEAEVGDEARAQ